MRLSTLPKLLLVGAAGAYLLHRARTSPARPVRRAPQARHARGTVPPPDPTDPVQSLDSELDLGGEPAETLYAEDVYLHDTGDLYGVHVPPAQTTSHLDQDAAMDGGQTWLEALETDAIEGGPLPERTLEIIDDEELEHTSHRSDTRDTPVADRGSGGPAGA